MGGLAGGLDGKVSLIYEKKMRQGDALFPSFSLDIAVILTLL